MYEGGWGSTRRREAGMDCIVLGRGTCHAVVTTVGLGTPQFTPP